ncbi:MAG: hypothetical protein M0P73_18655 [Syntrophobacterales bacterium]|jgi:hypothetical protein|nr:hypothetical protein [Syntrophobacterales bacterium]
MIKRLQLISALGLILVLTLAGAGRAAGPTQEECDLGGFDSPAKLISLITNLKKAVKNGDKAAVAALVDYPIVVSQGKSEREIANQADFIKNYDAIMTMPVRDAVLNFKMKDYFINRRGLVMSDNSGKGSVWLINNTIYKIEQD